MRRPSHEDNRSRLLLRRIDKAAGEMTPYLFGLVIGLAALDLTCLALLSTRFAVASIGQDGSACALGGNGGAGSPGPPRPQTR